MEDNRQYNNDGTTITDDIPVPSEGVPPPAKRRRNWNKLALLFILLGAGMIVSGWLSGARGGLEFSDGRFRIIEAGGNADTVMTITDNITELNVNSSSRIIVEPAAPGEPITVTLTNVGGPESVTISGSTLNIDTRERVRGFRLQLFNFDAGRHEIRVQIPAEQADSISLVSTSGGARVYGVNTETLNVRSTSGGIRLNNIQAASLSANSTSGGIRLNNVQAASLAVNSTSGGIRGEEVHFSEGDLLSASGGINLEDISWDSLTARSTSGRIRIQDARIHLNRVSGGHTDFQASSGGVGLETRNSRSDFSYSLSSSSGSVRVDGEGVRGGGRNISGGNGQHQITMRASSGGVRLDFGS